jgi:hypothetical protein
MSRKQNSTKKPDWKEMLAEQPGFLRPLVQDLVQEALEAEMDGPWVRLRVNGRRPGWVIAPGTTAGP